MGHDVSSILAQLMTKCHPIIGVDGNPKWRERKENQCQAKESVEVLKKQGTPCTILVGMLHLTRDMKAMGREDTKDEPGSLSLSVIENAQSLLAQAIAETSTIMVTGLRVGNWKRNHIRRRGKSTDVPSRARHE